MAVIDYTVDWAQRAIDLVKSKAPDYLVVEALANRDQKKKDLNLTEKEAGSDTALKQYLSALSMAVSNQVTAVNPVQQDQSGVVQLQADPLFDPNDFLQSIPLYSQVASSESTTSDGGAKIAGYVIVGLVAIVLLDKLMK